MLAIFLNCENTMKSIKDYSIFQLHAAPQILLPEFLATTVFECLITIFAVWTVLTHAARLIGLSFASLSIFFSILMLPILLVLIRSICLQCRYSKVIVSKVEIHTLVLLGILMIIGATLSLGAIRPALDDVDYTSQVVYFLKHSSLPLDLLRHDHGLVQVPFFWPLYIFYALELWCAYLAVILHLPFLHIYHLFLPALGGLLIPLAWFLVFSKFSHRTIIALLAATGVCVFLSLNGSPHRAFGNFAFVRIWHGKAILMSIITPVFIAFTRDFFKSSTFVHWRRLLTLIIMTTGLSAMSAFFLPFMGIVGVSYWLIQDERTFKKLLLFFSSYIYLILIVGYFGAIFNRAAMKYHGQVGWPTTFEGQFKLVFIDMGSIPTVLFIFFTILSLFIAKKSERQFLGLWILGTLSLLLNPIVFPIISNYATSLNNYWRLFYLLPFPFVVGFPMTYLENKLPIKPVWGYFFFASLMLMAVIGNSYSNKYATFGKLRFSFGQYKIEPTLESDVKQIITASNPGMMLAPYRYSAVIPVFSPDFPQVSVKGYMLMSLAAAQGKIIEAEMKIRAIHYISGGSSEGLSETISLISKGIMTIVVNPKVTTYGNWPTMEDWLKRNHFKRTVQNNRFLLYKKEA